MLRPRHRLVTFAVVMAASGFGWVRADPSKPEHQISGEQNNPGKAREQCLSAFGRWEAANRKLTSARALGRDDPARGKAVETAFYQLRESTDIFREVFLRTDWSQWSAKTDQRLLQRGLAEVVQEGKRGGDAADTVRAYDQLAFHFPESKELRDGHSLIPQKLLELGRVHDAIERAEQFLVTAYPTHKPSIYRMLGDLYCAAGNVSAARRAYARVMESTERLRQGSSAGKKASGQALAEKNQPYAEFALAVIGRKAPEIRSREWISQEPFTLSASKGSCVAIGFWGTWLVPSFELLYALNDVYVKRRQQGFEVLGMNLYSKNGYLPPGIQADEGTSFSDLTEETARIFLASFKERTQVAYPLVVATQSNLNDYAIRGIPACVLIDRGGTIRLAAMGKVNPALLEAAIEQLLTIPPNAPAKN